MTTFPRSLIPDFIELSEFSDFRVLESEAEDATSKRVTDEQEGWKTTLKLTYTALTLEECVLLIQFYNSVQGKFDWFRLPQTVFNLDSTYKDRVTELVDDFKWKFANTPTIATEINGIHKVDVELEAVKTVFNSIAVEVEEKVEKEKNIGIGGVEFNLVAHPVEGSLKGSEEEKTIGGVSVQVVAHPVEYTTTLGDRVLDTVQFNINVGDVTTTSAQGEEPLFADNCSILKFKVETVDGAYRVYKSDVGWRIYFEHTGNLVVRFPANLDAGWQIELAKFSSDEEAVITFEAVAGKDEEIRFLYSGGTDYNSLYRAYGVIHVLSMGLRAIPGDSSLKWTYHIVGANASAV